MSTASNVPSFRGGAAVGPGSYPRRIGHDPTSARLSCDSRADGEYTFGM